MTDNPNDFEHHDQDMDLNEEPAPRRDLRSNLTEAWRTRPLFKLLVVMTVAGAIFAAVASFFSGGPPPAPQASLAKPPSVRQPPGGEASSYFKEQLNAADKQRIDAALATGQSAMPTPVGLAANLDQTEKKNDQLNELRAEVAYLKQQQQQVQTTRQQQVQTAAPKPFDEGLANAMQGQMKQLMESWSPRGMKSVSGVKEDEGAKPAQAGLPPGQFTPVSTATPPKEVKPLVPAGTVSYAQLLVEANSDVPGPIMAQIVSGPLSGARAIGQFSIANGYSDYLVLQFRLANLKGKDIPISAIALDPDTTLTGMATEVDQRYFTRVILPAAASFIQAFGSALGQTDTTVVTNGQSTIVSQGELGMEQGLYRGLGNAGQTISQFFQNQANQTRPLVRVAAGTPMGLFFLNSVYSDPPPPGSQAAAAQATNNAMLAPYGGTGGRLSGYPGYGQAGQLASAYGTNPYGAGAAPYSNPGTPYSPYGVTNYGGGLSPYGGIGSPGSVYYGPQGLVPGLYGR